MYFENKYGIIFMKVILIIILSCIGSVILLYWLMLYENGWKYMILSKKGLFLYGKINSNNLWCGMWSGGFNGYSFMSC